MKSPTRALAVARLLGLTLLASCGGAGSPIITPPPHVSGWTWISGANTAGQSGVYGTQGTASSSNVPEARHLGVCWIDKRVISGSSAKMVAIPPGPSAI